MLRKIKELFPGILPPLLGGVALLTSFVLARAGIGPPADPAWLTLLLCGLPILVSALKRLIMERGLARISSPLLISIAMAAALCIGELPAAAEVAFIMALGELLEEVTCSRARRDIHRLSRLAPLTGRRLGDGGSEEIVPLAAIRVDDLLRVLPGETIPVDGVVTAGESAVDQSSLTGESLPVDKAPGSSLFSGTLNGYGMLDMRVRKLPEDSSLSRLIRLVQEAGDDAPTRRTADRWASRLVPLALLIALLTLLITRDPVRAVTVLVVFCPCSLVLATPTAIMAAIGQATQQGIVIGSGRSLEETGKMDTLALDKTGTLTTGKPVVSDILPLQEGCDPRDLLALAAAVEKGSNHPLAAAILARARELGVPVPEASGCTTRAGLGASALVGGETLFVGSPRFLAAQGIALGDAGTQALAPFQRAGKACVLVARGKALLGIIALGDALRPGAKAALDALKELGLDPMLLTGDSEGAAAYLAARLGIQNVRAELLPPDKAAHIAAHKTLGHRVMMVGDGINDAPALKTANVGVAFCAADMAVDAADVVVLREDLMALPYLVRLSRAAMRTIGISIALSMVINLLALALSTAGLLGPVSGALVHNAGALAVILLSACLYGRKV
ncbi:MAG: heavy metal translocating P-type ATPase [Candidatus Excrementavichristensenella sp.]|jgi:Cu+-exporting ATPase